MSPALPTIRVGFALVALAIGISTPAPAAAEPGELRRGRLLVATRQLGGPFFGRTVVLLLDYSGAGAVGLVINRPTDHTLAEVVDGLEGLEGLGERSDPVYAGGPVEIGSSLMLLIRSEKVIDGASAIVDDIQVTASAATLRALVSANAPPTSFRAYVGYAGWGPRQLDGELARGDWYVSHSRSELVFETAAADIWPRLIRENEGLEVRRSPSPSRRASAARAEGLDGTPGAVEDPPDLVHHLRVALRPGDGA
jgi:putative transcriptional regulator